MTVRGGILWLIECPTHVHEQSAEALCNGLKDELNKCVVGPTQRFTAEGHSSFRRYVNQLECGGTDVQKMPDQSLMPKPRGHTMRSNPAIVIETAFRNENYRQLMIEGSGWLNEFNDVDMAFLLLGNENARKTDVFSFDFIAFKRMYPL